MENVKDWKCAKGDRISAPKINLSWSWDLGHMTSRGNGTADGRKGRTMRWKILLDSLGRPSGLQGFWQQRPFPSWVKLPAEAGGRRTWRTPDLLALEAGPRSKNAVASSSWDDPKLADSKDSGPESSSSPHARKPTHRKRKKPTLHRSAGLIFERLGL